MKLFFYTKPTKGIMNSVVKNFASQTKVGK